MTEFIHGSYHLVVVWEAKFASILVEVLFVEIPCVEDTYLNDLDHIDNNLAAG